MSSPQPGFKEIRSRFERAAVAQHTTVSAAQHTTVTDDYNASDRSDIHFSSGHHSVALKPKIHSLVHTKGLSLHFDRQAHSTQGVSATYSVEGSRPDGGVPKTQHCRDTLIPPPVRKFTTTNPNTLSPTYHLFYDLTTHLPHLSGPGDASLPGPSTFPVKSVLGRVDLPRKVPNHRVSTDEFRGVTNKASGHRYTSNNHDISTFKDDKQLIVEVNRESQNRNNSIFMSNILSRHQESMCGVNETQNSSVERTLKHPQETPLHRRTSDAKFADINANTSDSAAWDQNTNNIFNNGVNRATRQDFLNAHNRPATCISAQVIQKPTGQLARQWKFHKAKIQIDREELNRGHPSYPIASGVDLDQFVCSSNGTGHEDIIASVSQTRSGDGYTNGTEEKPVSFWYSNVAVPELNSPGTPLEPDINVSETFTTLAGGPFDFKHRKRMVFKREGDSVRMFIVNDETPCNDDSGVASDPETFSATQEIPDVPMTSLNDGRKNSSHSLLSLSSFLLESLMSKSKKRGKGPTKDNVKSARGVVTINNDLLSAGSSVRVSKNQVNRWKNLHVMSAPLPRAGVDGEKRKGATKEKSSAQSGLSTPTLDINKPALRRDPSCHLHRTAGIEGGGKDRANNVGQRGPSKPAIKGILVNKDSVSSGYRLGHTHKVNTVQFIEDPVTEGDSDSSNTLKPRRDLILVADQSSSATFRRDVIDRNKYIIKRDLVIDGPIHVSQSLDTPRSTTSDSLDNFHPTCDRIAPQGNSSETRDSSVRGDTRVDVRQAKLDSRVAVENGRGQSFEVIRTFNTNPRSSDLGSVENSGYLARDRETHWPGLDKQHENSSNDRKIRGEHEDSLHQFNWHTSHVGHSPLLTGSSLNNQIDGKTESTLHDSRIGLSHFTDIGTSDSINIDKITTECVGISKTTSAHISTIENKTEQVDSREIRANGDLVYSKLQPSAQHAAQKIRPRQKFEIRHNKIAGKVGARLRLNSQVNGDVSETKYQDENTVTDPGHVILVSALAPHKDSPRARFERDRAARSHAVTASELPAESLCGRLEADRKSDEHTLLGLIPDGDKPVGVVLRSSRISGRVDDASSSPPELPPPKLPPRVKLAHKPTPAATFDSAACGSRDSFTDNNFISFNARFHSNPDIEPETREALGACQQQHAEKIWSISHDTFLSGERKEGFKDVNFITEDTQKHIFPLSDCVDCVNSDQKNILNRNFPKDLCCDFHNDARSKTEFTADSRVGDYSKKTDNCLTLLNSDKNSPNKSNENLFNQTEILSNQNATTSAHHVGLSGFKREAPGSQWVSALKKVSPDSASSSGYDSEANTSAIRSFFQGIDCVSNNEYLRQVLTHSSVQQLRLLFGHEDDQQESVNPQRPCHSATRLSSLTSRCRPREEFNANSATQIRNCTFENQSAQSPDGDNTHSFLNDALLLNSPRGRQDKQNNEVDNSSDSFHSLFPQCFSNYSPNQRLSCKCIEDYTHYNPHPIQCSPVKDCLENRDSLPGAVVCSQVEKEDISSSIDKDVKDTNIRNKFPCINIRALVVSEAEAEMLASKGIRIYESGEDYVAMVSPVRSPLNNSLSSPQFLWEGTTYLIVPTVLDSLGTSAVQNDRSAARDGNNNNPDLVTHRSISDGGAPGQFLDNIQSDGNEASVNNSGVYLTMTSSGSGRLTEQSRAMSVEVLCTKGVKPNENWDNVTPSVGLVRRRKNKFTNDRGYVEWKTCSGWVGNTDMRTGSDCRNSQGYVEWDTIWTTAAPWRSPTKGDEHVYDVIGEDQSPQTQNTPSVTVNGGDNKDSTSEGVDTPPALPERTYIHRLKNSNANGSSSFNQHAGVACASTPPSSRHKHSGHPSHNSSCTKHHHHHHHHHNSGKHHKSQPPVLTTSTSSTHLPPTPMSSLGQPQKPTAGVHSPTADGGAPKWPASGDPSHNYAEVNKLRGYTFSNLMLATDSPAPHHPDKTAISSENYWHLAPMTPPDSVTSWQTGDVLDYIDGLHDSMSPKRRENIYILLNNKKTRAKFSESLEIESRLLSRGLISNSCESPSDKAAGVPPMVKSGTVKPVVIRRKGAIAPVSSTYV